MVPGQPDNMENSWPTLFSSFRLFVWICSVCVCFSIGMCLRWSQRCSSWYLLWSDSRETWRWL